MAGMTSDRGVLRLTQAISGKTKESPAGKKRMEIMVISLNGTINLLELSLLDEGGYTFDNRVLLVFVGVVVAFEVNAEQSAEALPECGAE